MGLLELMLGQSGPGERGVEGRSYKLPKETHEFVYPVAVRRTEIDAFAGLLEAEAEAPAVEGDADELQAVFEDVLGDVEVDAEELAERQREPRRETETILDHWDDQVTGDVGVVYALPDTYPTLLSFVERCKRRDERTDDPFELTADFAAGTALLKRLDAATDDQYRAVVHTDLLPADA